MSDFRSTDGTHPSDPQGVEKVAQLLLDWFKQDLASAPWFLADGNQIGGEIVPGTNPPADAELDPGSLDVPMVGVALMTDAASERTEWYGLELSLNGDHDPATDVSALRVWQDVDQDGHLDVGEPLLAENLAPTSSLVALEFDHSIVVPPGQYESLIVTLDLAADIAPPPSFEEARVTPEVPGPRAIGLASWILGAALLGAWLRPRRALQVAVSAAGLLCLCWLSCVRGGSSGGEAPPDPPVLVTSTYQVGLEDASARGLPSGRPATIRGLPLEGREIRVEHEVP
jgi:hypothetical protein